MYLKEVGVEFVVYDRFIVMWIWLKTQPSTSKQLATYVREYTQQWTCPSPPIALWWRQCADGCLTPCVPQPSAWECSTGALLSLRLEPYFQPVHHFLPKASSARQLSCWSACGASSSRRLSRPDIPGLFVHWWISWTKGLRQCRIIMVGTQNIDTMGAMVMFIINILRTINL